MCSVTACASPVLETLLGVAWFVSWACGLYWFVRWQWKWPSDNPISAHHHQYVDGRCIRCGIESRAVQRARYRNG